MADRKNVYDWFSIAFHQFFSIKTKDLLKNFYEKLDIATLLRHI